MEPVKKLVDLRPGNPVTTGLGGWHLMCWCTDSKVMASKLSDLLMNWMCHDVSDHAHWLWPFDCHVQSFSSGKWWSSNIKHMEFGVLFSDTYLSWVKIAVWGLRGFWGCLGYSCMKTVTATSCWLDRSSPRPKKACPFFTDFSHSWGSWQRAPVREVGVPRQLQERPPCPNCIDMIKPYDAIFVCIHTSSLCYIYIHT